MDMVLINISPLYALGYPIVYMSLKFGGSIWIAKQHPAYKLYRKQRDFKALACDFLGTKVTADPDLINTRM